MAFDLSMPILVVDDYNAMVRIIRNLLKQSDSKTWTMPATDRPRSPDRAAVLLRLGFFIHG